MYNRHTKSRDDWVRRLIASVNWLFVCLFDWLIVWLVFYGTSTQNRTICANLPGRETGSSGLGKPTRNNVRLFITSCSWILQRNEFHVKRERVLFWKQSRRILVHTHTHTRYCFVRTNAICLSVNCVDLSTNIKSNVFQHLHLNNGYCGEIRRQFIVSDLVNGRLFCLPSLEKLRLLWLLRSTMVRSAQITHLAAELISVHRMEIDWIMYRSVVIIYLRFRRRSIVCCCIAFFRASLGIQQLQ